MRRAAVRQLIFVRRVCADEVLVQRDRRRRAPRQGLDDRHQDLVHEFARRVAVARASERHRKDAVAIEPVELGLGSAVPRTDALRQVALRDRTPRPVACQAALAAHDSAKARGALGFCGLPPAFPAATMRHRTCMWGRNS